LENLKLEKLKLEAKDTPKKKNVPALQLIDSKLVERSSIVVRESYVIEGEYIGARVLLKYCKADQNKYLNEIRLSAKIQHPNCAHILGYIEQPEPTLVMSYYTRTLHTLIYNYDITIDVKKMLASGVISGLKYLHTASILHRDIKPPNILIADGNRAVLYNYSSSTYINEQTIDLVGTPFYLAPEVLKTKKYSKASDIYALGITIWELFEQKRPYHHLKLPTDWQAAENKIHSENHRPIFSDATAQNVRTVINTLWDSEDKNRKLISLSDIKTRIESL